MIIYNFIKYLCLYIKYLKILNKTYKEENIIRKLEIALGNIEFRKDWLGRLYTIINPFLQNISNEQNGKQSVIFDITANGSLTTKSHIEKWIFERFALIDQWMRAENMWEMLEYRLERIDKNENYLFVLQPVPFELFKKWTKYFALELILIIILILLFIILI